MQILEVGALARPAHAFAALLVRRHLDLDDIGAPVGELPHAGGAGPDPGEVEDGEARKRLGSLRKRHGCGFRPGSLARPGPSPISPMLSTAAAPPARHERLLAGSRFTYTFRS